MKYIIHVLIFIPMDSFGQVEIHHNCICFDSIALIMNKEGKYIIEDRPIYPGGNKMLMHYLKKNTRLNNNINAKLYVTFVVNCTGLACGFKLECIDGYVNKESESVFINVLKGMEKWKPGKLRGRKVDCPYGIVIEIKNGKLNEIVN